MPPMIRASPVPRNQTSQRMNMNCTVAVIVGRASVPQPSVGMPTCMFAVATRCSRLRADERKLSMRARSVLPSFVCRSVLLSMM